MIQSIPTYPLSEALGAPFSHASHSRNAYNLYDTWNGGDIKMGRSSLLSHRNTKTTLVAWHLSPLVPSFSPFGRIYIRKPGSTYEKFKGGESGTFIERGWQQRRGDCMLSYLLIAVNHIYLYLICIVSYFMPVYWGLWGTIEFGYGRSVPAYIKYLKMVNMSVGKTRWAGHCALLTIIICIVPCFFPTLLWIGEAQLSSDIEDQCLLIKKILKMVASVFVSPSSKIYVMCSVSMG
jgi:hypothetical protein